MLLTTLYWIGHLACNLRQGLICHLQLCPDLRKVEVLAINICRYGGSAVFVTCQSLGYARRRNRSRGTLLKKPKAYIALTQDFSNLSLAHRLDQPGQLSSRLKSRCWSG
jgi:hypothetical protein